MKLGMVRGDSLIVDVTVTQVVNGATLPVDLTGATMWMTAKYKLSDADNAAIFQITTTGGDITITDAINGKARIVVPPTATQNVVYPTGTAQVTVFYDIQVRTNTGIVQTPANDMLTIGEDVTITS